MALRRQASSLERPEDAVGVGREDGRLLVRALGHRVPVLLRLIGWKPERLGRRIGPRPDPDDDLSEVAQLNRHLLRRAGLVEDRGEPDRRLRIAHLLEQRELERTLHRDHAAVVHRQPPRLPRSRSTASVRRASGTVREIRKKHSPLAPYDPPGETTTPDSSSTI